MSNFPSLHQDLLGGRWATEQDFARALAIGQMSPGPGGLWVISLGYLTYGYLGAGLALLAVSLPPLCVLFVLIIYQRIEHARWVTGLIRGITLAAMGLVVLSAIILLQQPGMDWKSWCIALAAFGLRLRSHIHPVLILLLAALVGIIIPR